VKQLEIKDKKVWYPYQQMKLDKRLYRVVGGSGPYIRVVHQEKNEEKELLDGVSSWWCAVHGYCNEELNNAIKEQLDKIGHVMLGGFTHDPVEKLAEKLVEITPEGLNHVFFSDSGSVGVEVAIKMAVQYFSNHGRKEKKKMIGLTNAYHGDTFKAMEVGDDPDFHGAFKHTFKDVYHINAPKGGYYASNDEVEVAVAELRAILEKDGENIAAFILEPLIQASGGFIFYSPRYLEEVRRECDKYDVLLIFDEVATGFGRTGKLFATNHTNIIPDIMVLGKALTGGYLGHAATITTSKIFEAFWGDTYELAFMHGPTFMGNPITCAVALKSIEIFQRDNYLLKIEKINKILEEELLSFESPLVKATRVLGVTGVIEVHNSKLLKNAQAYAYERGAFIRPFGNYLYIMPSYIVNEEEVRKLCRIMKSYIKTVE
jgi:adenosylmethionine-8-amino-7-oxononanoate aminotransferase